MRLIRSSEEKILDRTAIALATLTALLAVLPVALRRMANRRERVEPSPEPELDPVDEASRESFPASDPPAW